ncbi:putative inner membrane protein [Oryzomicrobium terrae]|uniref:Putative inner membrane protein n=1 Tax=Oryzomicrobium terrae TaxID=1735038 RepID=A0A5C1ECE3_9RHOO|nr:VTT domain-containing protein [Oryzomicrobium terrae]QEL66563.1 putative inner membrane protein [Oryzomicrobium terrae]
MIDLPSWLPVWLQPQLWSIEAGLASLFVAAFLAATLLPLGSEALFFAFLYAHPDTLVPALLLTTLGNTLGGMTSYAAGRALPHGSRWEKLSSGQGPISPALFAQVQRWGSPSLLLAWAPLVGDALCLAAGWLRLHWLPCALYMAVGKAARYGVLAAGAGWLVH